MGRWRKEVRGGLESQINAKKTPPHLCGSANPQQPVVEEMEWPEGLLSNPTPGCFRIKSISFGLYQVTLNFLKN
jgi:hypothetical protein